MRTLQSRRKPSVRTLQSPRNSLVLNQRRTTVLLILQRPVQANFHSSMYCFDNQTLSPTRSECLGDEKRGGRGGWGGGERGGTREAVVKDASV